MVSGGNMIFPIKFKYLTIDKGLTAVQKADEVALPGYECKDADGVTIASGTSLAGIFEYALQLDQQYELMGQYIGRGHLEALKHLDDVDCDDTGPVGLVAPGLIGGSGGLVH
jgi:hypothetical protein